MDCEPSRFAARRGWPRSQLLQGDSELRSAAGRDGPRQCQFSGRLRQIRASPPCPARDFAGFSRVLRWPAVCLKKGMSAVAFKVRQKSGDYVRATIVPANHSEEPHFGVLDGVIIGFFLLCVGGLIALFLA